MDLVMDDVQIQSIWVLLVVVSDIYSTCEVKSFDLGEYAED